MELEKICLGYEDYINCEQEHFKETLEKLNKLVESIQKDSIFSSNETFSEIHTENIKLLMIPYYQAEILLRIMENREQNVQKGHVYYLEYLKLMNHYHLLDNAQITQWKTMNREYIERNKDTDEKT